LYGLILAALVASPFYTSGPFPACHGTPFGKDVFFYGDGPFPPACGASVIADFAPSQPTLAEVLAEDPAPFGTTGTLVFAYVGSQATGDGWEATAGDDLTAQGSAGAFEQVGALGAHEVQSEGTRYYNTATAPSFGTDDFYVEALITGEPDSAASVLWDQRDGGGEGLELQTDSGGSGRIQLVVEDTSGNFVSITGPGDLSDGGQVFVQVFGDKSGDGYLCTNLECGSAQSLSSVGDVDTDSSFGLLNRSDGGVGNAAAITFIRAYRGVAGFLDTSDTATMLAYVRKRGARVMGVDSVQGEGPNANTDRSSVAYLERDGTLVAVDRDWMRTEEDSSGDAYYLAEEESENLLLQNTDLSTSWTLEDAGDSVGGSTTAPDGSTCTTCGIVGDSTDGNHGVQQAVTVTADTYTYSCLAEAGVESWARLLNTTVSDADAYFDLSGSGSVGTTGAGVSDTFVDRIGSSVWYLIGISYTGTAASHTHVARVAEADGDDSVVGDGATAQVFFWGCHVEEGPTPTSRILTTTAAVTRDTDRLEYTVDELDITSSGISLVSVFNRGAFDSSATAYLLSLSDGNNNDDRIEARFRPSDGNQMIVVAGGVTQSTSDGTEATDDGASHTMALFASDDDMALYLDGVSIATDTSGTMPDDLDTLGVGVASSGALADRSLRVYSAKIYRGRVTQ